MYGTRERCNNECLPAAGVADDALVHLDSAVDLADEPVNNSKNIEKDTTIIPWMTDQKCGNTACEGLPHPPEHRLENKTRRKW